MGSIDVSLPRFFAVTLVDARLNLDLGLLVKGGMISGSSWK